jgi:GDP-mannose 6-dehydrogenase
MKIAVFGLGYVGSVTSVCLALNGHEVWGVDVDAIKVDWISKGIPPLKEPAFAERLRTVLDAGRLKVTMDARLAIRQTEAALICVGTPTSNTGETYLGAVEHAIMGLNEALLAEPHPYLIAVRSTIPPGTMQQLILPLLQAGAGRSMGDDLGVCFNPEFLREGTAIDDFFAPPFTVVGIEGETAVADAIVSQVEKIYALPNVPTVRLNFKEAELVKVISNAFHAMKIDFANEVGSLAVRLGADPERLMDAFCLDTKLNISPKYLRPGFAFGGSCLPKDVRGLTHVAHKLGLSLPLIEAILPSNQEHLKRALSAVQSHPGRVVGLAGLVFKADTDDVRESPAVLLARALLDAGKDVLIYEPEIQLDRLVGANLAHLEERLPEFRKRFVDWPTLAAQADVVVVSRSMVVSQPSMEQLKQLKIILHRLHPQSNPA